MAKTFRKGDRVSWNSEAGRVSGKIVKVHTKDVNYKGYVHHASKENPQYEIRATRPTTWLCTRRVRFGAYAGNPK